MSAHKSIQQGASSHRKVSNRVNTTKERANELVLGIILIVITIVLMAGVLIFMSLSGTGGESVLLVGILPFIAIFLLLLLTK